MLRKYAFWIRVSNLIEEEDNLTYKHNIPIIIKNMHLDQGGNVSPFIWKVKKQLNKINKKQDYSLLGVFAVELSKRSSVGRECENVGISET